MARAPLVYNRFVRWRQAGVWDQIMGALAARHDVAVQMIDTSVVRLHQTRSLYLRTTITKILQSPRYGALTRGSDEQDSRGGGYQRPARPSRLYARRDA